MVKRFQHIGIRVRFVLGEIHAVAVVRGSVAKLVRVYPRILLFE